MCGLAGFVTGSALSADELNRTVRRMSDAIVHRGPDGRGEWSDPAHGIAMGFRRLAILDLSSAGDQPMVSASARYVATFNGEIYNFQELRRELERGGLAPAFRGHSDTEVMLAAFDAWGMAGAVRRFNGMFAVAVWDRHRRRLYLIRDRMGVKPLYYGFAGQTFLYGSELKALRQHPEFDATINRAAVQLYLRFLSVPEPYSIYNGIEKLMPGTILSFDPATRQVETSVYWSVLNAVACGREASFEGTEEEAAIELERLALDAVGLRMIADVPLGVFLSGGMDSSLVTALMQAQSHGAVKSFAVGFADARYDETGYARAVAAHLGTAHTEVIMTPDEVMAVIPRLPSMFDEPFADSSQIPTHLVSSLARRHVTVSLSGDGGDELFGGYVRYFFGQQLLRRFSGIPRWMRPMLARAIMMLPSHSWDRALALGRRFVPDELRRPRSGDRVHKIARVLGAGDPDALYFELVSHWPELVDAAAAPTSSVVRSANPALDDPVERMMFFDQISYLPNDILTKVDRASMAVSLEAREPLLDYRLVEFAWTLPLAMKVREGKGKHLLRRILQRYLPASLIDRPKMGFAIPLEHWLRGPLRDWAESLLDPRVMSQDGLMNPAPILARWREHLSGTADWKSELWAILMLQAWLQENRARCRNAA